MNGGAAISPSDYQLQGIPTVPKGSINNIGVADLSGEKFVSEEFYANNLTAHIESNSLLTSLRDLVPTAPNLGRIVKLKGSQKHYLMPQGVYKLKLKPAINQSFLIQYSNIYQFRKQVYQEKNGSTQVHLRNDEYLHLKLSLPNSFEQERIGRLFYTVNNLIAANEDKKKIALKYQRRFILLLLSY